MRVLACLFILIICTPVQASFDNLVDYVSSKTNVPTWVIKRVCIHESQSFSNNRRQAWPWTVNVAGEGNWFKSKRYAVRYANKILAEGKRNLDIGICQMNWRYHHKKFVDVEGMFDPRNNMTEAALYIKKQKGEDSWEIAIGKYHSPANKERAEAYRKIVLSKPLY